MYHTLYEIYANLSKLIKQKRKEKEKKTKTKLSNERI